MAETTEQLHVWVLDDGGETWWWSAPTMARALVLHVELNYIEAGEKLDELDGITLRGQVPDDKMLTVRETESPQTRPALDWCKGGEGFVATTYY